MSDGGKGSTPRPFSVPRKTFEENFDAIFGPRTKEPECPLCDEPHNEGQDCPFTKNDK
jgi:hypothetical protein